MPGDETSKTISAIRHAIRWTASIKMKLYFVLSLSVIAVVAARGQHHHRHSHPTPRPSGTEAPPRCSEHVFAILRHCHIHCLVRQEGGDMYGCTQCNETCNQLTADRRPHNHEINLTECRVNATFFATLVSCHPWCVERRLHDSCFMCNRECNETTHENLTAQCGIRERNGQERQCEHGHLCLLEVTFNRCIRMPHVGDSCERRHADQEDEDDDNDVEELDDSGFTHIEGASERHRAFTLQYSAETEVPCLNGSYCSNQGQCLPIEGPCTHARNTRNAHVHCHHKNGNFQPLQCHRMHDGTHTCHCVHPRNGSMVHNTMRRRIRHRGDVPDCESRVFRFCHYHHEGRNFSIRHGETFVHRQNCTRCHCHNGSAVSCRVDSRVNCRALNPGETPQSCRLRNVTIPHGTSYRVGKCNACGCNNGRLTCTDIEECKHAGEKGHDERERRCKKCRHVAQRHVCGRDGRTYLSRCIAMNCSGLRDVDILDGPCSKQPICHLFPCKPGLACIPLGGRSCLKNEGCSDAERRICVNRTALKCRAFNEVKDGFDIDENDTVCGSDGNTYQSFCHLIQMAPPNTKIVHTGGCDRKECRSGKVCGTDGVTYNSICHLRSQSANAQVDYKGACEDGDDKKPWEICRSIKDEKKLCEDTQETCTRRVLSKDGCCPICGGITTLAIDKDALDEYSRATDSNANLDEFMAKMTRGDVIPSHVWKRCTVEVTHVRNSTQTNIEVKIIAKHKKHDSDFCHHSSLTFAIMINNATNSTSGSDGGTVVNSTLPVEVSFTRAAAAAPLIADSDQQGDNGAPSVVIPSIMLLGVAALLAALI